MKQEQDQHIAGEHEVKETDAVDRYYPDHPPRTESSLFRHTKHQLVAVLDTPCKVCGSKDKREVHHFHAEWADANGIDWDKMRKLHPDFHWETFVSAEDFIDSPYNMMVLCEKHHRAPNHGIHHMPYPDWVMQMNKLESFSFSPDEAKN
ncbi:hypothetical protein P0D69_28075 [Paraburkholderia sediminicola]|uniref:hypothetical protein n=1 Tax=Paraburkholderia sediminicola TaxID=458836 RepID=UPI0038BAF6E6